MINLETAEGFQNLLKFGFCILGMCNCITCAGAWAYVKDDEILISNGKFGRAMQFGCVSASVAWWTFYVAIIVLDLMCCFRFHILITIFLIAYGFTLLTFAGEYLESIGEDADMFVGTNIGNVKLAIGIISVICLILLVIPTDFGILEMIGDW